LGYAVTASGFATVITWRRAGDLIVSTPAKINLFFEVFRKRADGFHEIETVMCPVSLYDTLILKRQPDGRQTLACRVLPSAAGTNVTAGESLPADDNNLVMRTVRLLGRRTGTGRGVSLLLVKRIPIASGLGGGSSDAAAALWALNAFWELGLSKSRLIELASELGSDVPFFLLGGSAICRGRGEILEPLQATPPLCVVVARPPVGLSTKLVYGRCKPGERISPNGMFDAFREGDIAKIGRTMFNRLEEAASQETPWIGKLKRAFSQSGAVGYGMSGSGSACFGLYRGMREARRVAKLLASKGPYRTFALRSCHDTTTVF